MNAIRWGTGCALLVAVIAAAGTTARAADKSKKQAGQGDDMQAYMKAAQPGPQHKLLQSLAGSWNFTAKMWMAPGQPPQEWKGTVERKVILGGRYLQEDASGSFAGMSFHGQGLNGYDNAQGKFVGTWVDSMGTGIAYSVGTADASGKVITYDREEFDPMTRSKSKGRDVLHVISPDKEVLVFNKVLPGGKEFKMMEIEYTRKGTK
jgi:hypothetical protein